MVSPPTGVVTFLFTDVEGSTALWAADDAAMAASLAEHDQILRTVVAEYGGYVFTTAGDSFAVAFQSASAGVAAAVSAQAHLAEAEWPGPALRVRMGLHMGEAVERGGDYFGPVVNLTARLESAGHGRQVLVTDVVRGAAGIDALGLGSHSLRDVPERVEVFQVGHGDFPPLRIEASHRTNLPVSPQRLIGRERELALVRESLERSRLVTLAAAGGTGKTRLALEAGEELLHHQRGGVWFVDLSTVARGEDVATAVAGALELQVGGEAPDRQVVEYLSGIDALVILDNCEHVVDACADLLDLFLTTSGASRVLATTREHFDIDGELAIRLPNLETDSVDSAGVELFIERALAADAEKVFDEDDRATIAELCGHLDGSPFAIELAASRCGVMTPVELLNAIDERFTLLGSGRRRRSRRALEDTLDWSYNLLDADEQRMFRCVSVFSGGFGIHAAAAVAELGTGAAVDLIESLVAKSLVLSERAAGTTRFRLLETPAAYAEQLARAAGEFDHLRAVHLDHFLAATEQFVVGSMPTLSAKEMSQDRANALVAIEWAHTSERWQDAARLMFAMYEAVAAQADVVFRLASRTAAHADEIPSPDDRRAIGALVGAGVQLDDFATVTELVTAMFGSDDPVRRLTATDIFAFVTMSSGDQAGALDLVTNADDMLAAIDDPVDQLQSQGRLEVIAAWCSAQLGDFEASVDRCRRAREAHQRLDMATSYTAMALFAESAANAELGRTGRALDLADELEPINTWYATSEDARVIAHLRAGDHEAAMPLLKAQALDAVTGRLSRAANDAMLYLALLAERDDPLLAGRRLMSVEQTRTPTTIALSMELARRLGVIDAFSDAQDRGRLDRAASGRRAIESLRSEMATLGWL